MPTLDAGEVGGPNDEDSDAHSLWEVDLAKLGLTNTEFDTIREDLRSPIVQECLEIHRFPRDLQNNPFVRLLSLFASGCMSICLRTSPTISSPRKKPKSDSGLLMNVSLTSVNC